MIRKVPKLLQPELDELELLPEPDELPELELLEPDEPELDELPED